MDSYLELNSCHPPHEQNILIHNFLELEELSNGQILLDGIRWYQPTIRGYPTELVTNAF